MIELIISKSNDPSYNLALEEYLVYNYKSDNQILYLWQNANTIVVGRNQNIYEQINLDIAKADDVKIVRRNTGGGTVFHDMGNICFSLISPLDEQLFSIGKILEPIISFLNHKEIKAEFSGKNDIQVEGSKISGSAELKTKEKILVHGTLLFNSDLSKIKKYLLLNQTKIESKKVKSKVASVRNIIEFLNDKKDSTDFIDEMVTFFQNNSDIKNLDIKNIPSLEIERLRDDKYLNWDWTFGKASTFTNSVEKYFDGKGIVNIKTNIKNGLIEEIKFFGDFLGYTGTTDLEKSLIGLKLDKEILKPVLEKANLEEIFWVGISSEDLLKLIY